MTDSTEPLIGTMAARQPTAAGSDLAARYHRDGYVVLADALSAGEAQALREEAVRICRGELGAVEGVQPAGPTSPMTWSSAAVCASTSLTSCPT